VKSVFVELGGELEDGFLESGIILGWEFEKFGEIAKNEIGSEVVGKNDRNVGAQAKVFKDDTCRGRVVKMNKIGLKVEQNFFKLEGIGSDEAKIFSHRGAIGGETVVDGRKRAIF